MFLRVLPKSSVSNSLSQSLFLKKPDLRVLIPEMNLGMTLELYIEATYLLNCILNLLTSWLAMYPSSLVPGGALIAPEMWL